MGTTTIHQHQPPVIIAADEDEREQRRRELEDDRALRVTRGLQIRRRRGELEVPTDDAIAAAAEWLRREDRAANYYWIGGVQHDYSDGAWRGIPEPPRWLFMDAVTLAALDIMRQVGAHYDDELDCPSHVRVHVEAERSFAPIDEEDWRDAIRAALGLPRSWEASS